MLLALVFADTLHDHLLGGLRGDAAEIDGRQGIDDVIAERFVREQLHRVPGGHLGFFVFDRFHDLGPPRQPHVAGLAIDRRADVFLVAVLRLAGLLNGLLHSLEHFLALDILFPRDRVGDQQQFGACDGGIHGRPLSLATVIES